MSKLTVEQALFIAEYGQSQSFSQAVAASQLTMLTAAPEGGYYVYFLVNPLTDKIFYVGKGKNDRLHSHVKSLKAGQFNKSRKGAEILSILSADKRVGEYIFSEHSQEAEAYEIERGLIKALRAKQLKNAIRGIQTQQEAHSKRIPMLTPKQESFCMAYLETGNGSEAYRRVYATTTAKGNTIKRKAKELLDNTKLRTRIEELRAPAVAAAQLTLEQHLKDLKQLRDRAEAEGKYGPAIQAEIARGKASWLYSDKPLPNVDIPPVNSIADLPSFIASTLKVVTAGTITPAEGQSLVSLATAHGKAMELAELEQRITALEQHQGKGRY